ncbi:MAG: LytR/AlgR family response regulator transcription factor [Lachnospiraceae bacterium]
MIPIYICDDDRQILKSLKSVINNTIFINGYDMEIVEAAEDPECILEARKTKAKRSIYFLDIDLKSDKYNGFELAKEIRKLDTRGFIVFVTTHGELMQETFKYHIEAINYIIKDSVDELKQQISESLSEINVLIGKEQQDYENYYTVKVADTVYQIPMKEILFFETAAPHRLTLYSKYRSIEFRGDLSKIEQELKNDYLRVHQSFLVNKEAIKEVDKKLNILKLVDGSEIPISRRGKKVLL